MGGYYGQPSTVHEVSQGADARAKSDTINSSRRSSQCSQAMNAIRNVKHCSSVSEAKDGGGSHLRNEETGIHEILGRMFLGTLRMLARWQSPISTGEIERK